MICHGEESRRSGASRTILCYTSSMHIRASQAVGTQIVDDSVQATIGMVGDPLIDPDTGRILGFFVFSLMMGDAHIFLQTSDIVSWGTRVHVLSAERLGPPEDFIRLKQSLAETRTFLGQSIYTKESKKFLGRLGDVQFNTRTFIVEWLFPRKFFFYRQPILGSDVLEVTEEAILVRDPIRPAEKKLETEQGRTLLTETLPLQTPEVS